MGDGQRDKIGGAVGTDGGVWGLYGDGQQDCRHPRAGSPTGGLSPAPMELQLLPLLPLGAVGPLPPSRF